MHALISLTSPFYKSHASPRVWAVPYCPGQPGSSSLPLNFALGRETSLVSNIFPNILVPWLGLGALPALTLLSWPPSPHSFLSLSQLPFPSSRIWAALPEPPILESATLSLLTGNFLHPSTPPIAIHHWPIFLQGPLSVSPSCTQSCDLFLISLKS
jgi:hypothetical protein